MKHWNHQQAEPPVSPYCTPCIARKAERREPDNSLANYFLVAVEGSTQKKSSQRQRLSAQGQHQTQQNSPLPRVANLQGQQQPWKTAAERSSGVRSSRFHREGRWLFPAAKGCTPCVSAAADAASPTSRGCQPPAAPFTPVPTSDRPHRLPPPQLLQLRPPGML